MLHSVTSTLVKPAKYNIPEFVGIGTDSWMQTVEMYFDAARTLVEKKTKIVVTYPDGHAIEWWRGTGMISITIPWYKFCRYIGDRFSEISVCDNVRTFHDLTQNSTVNEYVLRFEQSMNLMRRDNPVLPNKCYKNSFISVLNDNIQHHVQSHEPADLQKAIWLPRLMEQDQPPKRQTI